MLSPVEARILLAQKKPAQCNTVAKTSASMDIIPIERTD
jgi:hypothetical protein